MVTIFEIIPWIFLIAGIILYIGAFITLNTYRVTRIENNLILGIFMLISANHTMQNSAFILNFTTFGGRFLFTIGNRLWFVMGILGIRLLETSGKSISKSIKSAYYTFSAAIIVYTIVNLTTVDRFVSQLSSNLNNNFVVVFTVFYLQSSIACFLFTYGMWKTEAINANAIRIKWLWLFGIGSWLVFYIFDFVFNVITGNNFGASSGLVVLVFFMITTLSWIVLLIFYPENLFLSQSLILYACKLYENVVKNSSLPKFDLPMNKVRQYLLSLPQDIWAETCSDQPTVDI